MLGFVSIVGAGPGPADYLTVKARKILMEAEAIVYDALVSEEVRALFPEKSQRIFCGKRSGKHLLSQNGINRLLCLLAKRGKRVVRLKGGDPLIFGRGGEECLSLQEAGIPYELVPGVSALNGIGAMAGIPLTHRGIAREVLVVEGHAARRKSEEWKRLATFEGTLVVFMGAENLLTMARSLLGNGADPGKPIALVETAPSGDVTVQRSRLGDVARFGLFRLTEGPGIIYVGQVVEVLTRNHQPLAEERRVHARTAAHLS